MCSVVGVGFCFVVFGVASRHATFLYKLFLDLFEIFSAYLTFSSLSTGNLNTWNVAIVYSILKNLSNITGFNLMRLRKEPLCKT